MFRALKKTNRLTHFAILLCASAFLAACQSGEERAEEHFQRALALIEEGDFDRARVEFQNVFVNNGQHAEARATFAQMQRERGQIQEAYSQYLRLVEQFPDHLEGRIALAEMALELRNWEEARRHGEAAIEDAPEDPRVQIIAAYLAYLDAVEAEDAPARRAAYDAARALLSDREPNNPLILRLTVDHALREGDLEGALAAADLALERTPDSRLLNDIRLSVLVELEQTDEVEAHLINMLNLFPEDEELPGLLLRYYVARGDDDGAVAFLREQAATAPDEGVRQDAQVAYVRLILNTDGPEAAIAELDRILEDGGSAAIFGSLRASIRFAEGEAESAIAELEGVLEGDLSLVDDGRVRVALARMLLTSGNLVGAQAQVAQVLEADPGQPDALKMQAAWLIDGDETDRAIALLRLALEAEPEDVQALNLMADAHARSGNRIVAQEFMALAVDASNSAPLETIRYARTLVEAERLLTAEELLVNALRLSPGHPEMMAALGEIYIILGDWPRVEQVEATLRSDGGEQGLRIANTLQASRLASQGRAEDAVEFLEGLASAQGSDAAAQIAVVRARLMTGDPEGAVAFADNLVAENPDDIAYRFVQATTQSAVGDLDTAEASFRALTEQVPEVQQAWIGLIRTLNGLGRPDEAEAVLQDALSTLPEALDLLWAQASFRERAGDIEGAIEIYELMYERAPGAEVVANNLASLLSTYREDDESLERAWAVARRLRGLEVPPFQDTYGWIAYRRGDLEDALEHLEPAALGLPQDPLVQFHLGMTYSALDQLEAAREQLQRALDLAGDDPRSQFDTARSEIARIEAALASAENEAAE